MKNLKENKNNSSNIFSSITMISIMITLLTFSAAMNTSLVVAAEGGGEEYDDIGIDSIKNSELSTLSLSSLPTRQCMNIGNISTDSDNVPSPDSSTSPSSLQEQDLLSLTDAATTNAACGQVLSGVVESTSDLNCSSGVLVCSWIILQKCY